VNGGRVYPHPEEVAADVRLTFTNAQAYNPPGSDVHVMALTLMELFNAKWTQVDTPSPHVIGSHVMASTLMELFDAKWTQVDTPSQ